MRTRLATFLLSSLSVLALNLGGARAELGASASTDTMSKSACTPASGKAARIISVEALTGIEDFSFAELRLEYAPRPSIVIEGPAEAIANVSYAIEDGVLRLEESGCIASVDGLRVTLFAPSFDEISARGASNIQTQGTIRSATGLTIDLEGATSSTLSVESQGEVVVFADGAGAHDLTINAPSLIALHTGSGEISLAGNAMGASLAELGRGTVATKHLVAQHIIVDIDGGGTVTALR